ncbi:MAG: hypothetical protein KIT16_13805 [Rhodospirillaceae bacterium]|nr:hypothetical protein [Rhodospirillaceae bacterium]
MLLKGGYHECALDLSIIGAIPLGKRIDNVPVVFLDDSELPRIEVGDVVALREHGLVAYGHVTKVLEKGV